MKVKAILKGNKITLPKFAIFKKPEVEVEIEIPDEDIQIYTEEDLEKMPLDELVHLIWDNVEVDEKEINRNYKELLIEALSERYK
jgi:hypothetical protein